MDTFAASLADLLDPPALEPWMRTPGTFAQHLSPKVRQTPMLDVIDDALVRFAEGLTKKQRVHCPIQTGKSERCSRWYPLWRLKLDPTVRLALISYQAGMAERWGRQVKRDLEAHPELGIELRQDSRAASRWETVQGGGIYCVGMTGAISGVAIDEAVIDDPIKNRAAAESQTIRENIWGFWENELGDRALKTLLVATRWHHDDLAGRLDEHEPGEWDIVSIPAIADSDDDALGREIGEEMESARGRPAGYYHELEKKRSPYVFNSLYQQRPTAAQGNIFKRDDWRFWHHGEDRIMLDQWGADLRDCTRFITIDLAVSQKTSADYTVAAAWAIPVSGDLVLLDIKRERVPEERHADFVAGLRQRWLTPYDFVYVESRMFGTTLVYALGREGVPVAELKADADKLTRAQPYADLVRAHRVWLPAGVERDGEIASPPWLDAWLDEHADFDKGTHDDMVDAGAYAARVVLAHWLPMASAEQERAMAPSRDAEPSLMGMQW